MAEYTWEAGTGDNTGKLFLKLGEEQVATLSGGLNAEAIAANANNYITVTEPTKTGDNVTAPGVIMLKETAFGTTDATITLTATDYALALEGATDDKLDKADAPEAGWSVTAGDSDTKTATYKAAGTSTNWTVGKAQAGDNYNNRITYAYKKDGETVATITGLKGNVSEAKLDETATSPVTFTAEPKMSGSAVTTKGTITIAASALPESSGTVTLSAGTEKYKLALANDVTIFDTDTSTPTVAVSDTTATISRLQSAGWAATTGATADTSFTYTEATNKTLATISNLKSGASASDITITSTTSGSTTTNTVTLKEGALGTGATAISVEIDNGNTEPAYQTFKLALDPSGTNYNATNKTIGFEDVANKWELTGSTATYKSAGKTEGWTLNTTNNTIGYTAATTITDLATISNLSTNVTVPTEGDNAGKIGTNTGVDGAFVEGITVNDSTNKITLSKAVLTTETTEGKETTLEQGHKPKTDGTAGNGEATNYTLELKASDNIPVSATQGAITLKDATVADAETKTVEVERALGEFWTLNTTTNKVSYTEATSETLATITNLNTETKLTAEGTTPADISLVDTTKAQIEIKLRHGALTTDTTEANTEKQITVTDNPVADDKTFKFVLDSTDDKIKAPETTPADSTIKLGETLKDYEGGDGKKALDVIGTLAAGYEVKDNTKILYTAERTPTLATITGLLATALADTTNITLDKTTNEIKMKGAAIGEASDAKATLTNGSRVGDLTPAYKFALADNNEKPGTEPTSIALGTPADDGGKKKIDIVGTLAQGYKVEAEGKEFSFQAAVPGKVLATITGLAADVNIAAEGGDISLDTDTNTVKLKSDALTTGNVVITPNTDSVNAGYETGYKLALDGTVPAFGDSISGEELVFSDITNGVAKIIGIKAAGWAVDTTGDTKDKKITYKPATAAGEKEIVATISGLKKLTFAEGVEPTSTDITLAETSGTPNGTITLNNAALTNSNVTLTAENSKYKLELDPTDTAYNTEDSSFGDKEQKYWDKSGVIAKYYSNKTEKWVVDTTGETKDKQITYTPQTSGTLLATITNLNNDFVLGEITTDAAGTKTAGSIGTNTGTEGAYVKGVKVAGSTITLSKNVLGTTASPMVLTNSNEATFTLALDNTEGDDGKVPTAAESKNIFELGATTKYKAVKTAYWKLDPAGGNKKIDYTPQEDVALIATITGLNSKIKDADINAVTNSDDNSTEGVDESKTGTITLSANALNKQLVKITNAEGYKYTLDIKADAVGKVTNPVVSNTKWSLNSTKTTATYTGNITEGYDKANDGLSVIYTAAKNGTKIAEVTGLNGDSKLYVSDDKSYIGLMNDADGSVSEDLKLGTDADAKKITLTKNVFGKSNIAVSGTNYILAIATGADAPPNETSATEADVWRVEGTTATYKNVKPAYYTIAEGSYPTSITYNPETTQKVEGTEKDKIYATVTGLKSGLKVNDEGEVVDADGNEVLKLKEGNTTTIVVSAGALGTSTTTPVKVTKGDGAAAEAKYLFEFDTGAGVVTTPSIKAGSLAWSLDGTTKTTAHLKGILEAGYTLGKQNAEDTVNNNQITYSAVNSNYTLATLTGLKTGLTNSDLTAANLAFTEPNAATKTITLSKNVLGDNKDVAVVLDDKGINGTKVGYALSLAAATDPAKTESTSEDVWEFNNGTATFKKQDSAYYTLAQAEGSEVNNKIVYHEPANITNIITLAGLKSGLKVENNAIAGIDKTETNKYSISADVLDGKNVTVTPGASIGEYKFKLADNTAPEKDAYFWTLSGTIAKYQFNSSAGYLQAEENGNITFQQARSGNTANLVATISGLKNGVKLADVETIAVDESSGTFTLPKAVLGTSNITLAEGTQVTDFGNNGELKDKLKLSLGTEDVANALKPQTGKVGWKKNSDSLTLQSFTTPGYTLSTDTVPKTITYSDWAHVTDLATVKGLKTNLTVKADDRTIDGIAVDSTTAKTVTLNAAGVFNGKDVEITKASGASDIYTLAVNSERNPQYGLSWDFKKNNNAGGTATLTETMSAGYDEGTGEKEGKIVVYIPKVTVTTTISGLNNNVEVSSDKTKIGIKGGTAADPTYSGITIPTATNAIAKTGEITLDKTVLTQKDVVLTNKSGGGTYTLKNPTGVDLVNAGNPFWYKAKPDATTAEYRTLTEVGYSRASDTKIVYNSKTEGTPTTLVTIKGIAKTATPEMLGTAIERTTEPKVDNPATTDVNEAKGGVFTIKSRDVLSTANLTITGNGIYKNSKFELAQSILVADIPDAEATWKFAKGTASLMAGKKDGWAFKQTKKGNSTITDEKTVVYQKAAPVTLATVTGLNTKKDKIKVVDGKIDGLEVVFTTEGTDENKKTVGTITVSAEKVLTNKNAVVTAKADGYKFKLAGDGDVFLPKDQGKYWDTDGKGKAFYRYDTTAGYTLSNEDTTYTYSKAKTTTLATISGLATAAIAKKDSTKTAVEKASDISPADFSGITVTGEPTTTVSGSTTTVTPGKITLDKASVLGNKITVSGDYEFEIHEDIDVDKVEQPKWYLSGTTATYRDYNDPGYAFATVKKKGQTATENKKVVEFKKETPLDTFVTLKGISKKTSDNTTVTADLINGDKLITVDSENKISFNKKIEGKATITLINGEQEYTFAEGYTPRVTDDPVWSYKKGTATLTQATSAGFIIDENKNKAGEQIGWKLVYSKAVNPTVATVKGLATDLVIPETGDGVAGEICVSNDAATPAYKPVLKVDKDTKLITIYNDALANKNVSLGSKYDYTLALDTTAGTGVRQSANTTTGWVVNGTNADYKNYVQDYYTLNDNKKGVTYTKPKNNTIYATVTGLKKGLAANALSESGIYTANESDLTKGGVLKLDARHLGEKTVKISTKLANTKNVDGFTLALNTEGANAAKESTLTRTSDTFQADNGGKVVIKGRLTEGFYPEFGGKTLTYTKSGGTEVNVATVTGLQKQATVEVDGSGVITLETDDLAKKNVAVTTSKGNVDYTLSISSLTAPTTLSDNTNAAGTEENPKDPAKKKSGWSFSGNTGTLKGYVTADGYKLAESHKAITYTGGVATTTKKKVGETETFYYKDTATLATIKGVKNTLTAPASGGTIALTDSNINGSALTINGGTFGVSINTGSNKTITGSAGADNISATGAGGLTITPGKGDDKISLSTGTGKNTLVYSNGDGNDVIANFTSSDKLQVKSGAVSVGKVDSDVVVKVGTGSIKLTGYPEKTIDIYDKNNNKTTYAIAGATSQINPLLVDDNYSMDAASLSDLVQGDSASFTPYDFSSNFSLTKEDKFIPAATYSDKK